MLLTGLSVATLANAQINSIKGSVKDDKGNPLSFVFVGDDQYKNAVFSDVSGDFTIPVSADSKLKFELKGYEDMLIDVSKNSNNFQIVMRSTSQGSSTAALSTQSRSDTALQRPNDVDFMQLPGHQKGQLHGSRYLYVNFVHGFVLNASDVLFHHPDYLFDYDKLEGKLLYTSNMTTVNEVSWDQTKSFTLYSSNGERLDFEKVPAIDNSHFSQVIASGKKYKIYKLIKTKFVRADYVNNGMAAHGNDYDEYLDDADYYFFDVQASQLKKMSPRKKAIKEVFAKEADKVNKYLSDNSGDINDAYLNKLVDFMNQ